MKKSFFYGAALLTALTLTTASCSDDNKGTNNGDWTYEGDAADIDYTLANADDWHNYMGVVADLLRTDASNLYSDWAESYQGGASYADYFKSHAEGTNFTSALSAIEQILDGCWDIANEVGEQKIGDPINKWNSGDRTGAVYAVESWYSWHSREDYSNNIISIYSALCGSRNVVVDNGLSLNLAQSEVAKNSIYNVVKNHDARRADALMQLVKAAHDAILNIPQPFRNNINSQEALDAQDACADLAEGLTEFKNWLHDESAINSDEVLSPVVNQYVDEVVLPTYADLRNETEELYQSIATLAQNRTDANFRAAADKWIEARAPWEKSEAFLFGPVADQGLDPNMDSWPLDQDGIVNILKSGDYGKLEWTGDFMTDENGDPVENIAAAQSVRGFHTLEFLLFKDGQARTVPAE